MDPFNVSDTSVEEYENKEPKTTDNPFGDDFDAAPLTPQVSDDLFASAPAVEDDFFNEQPLQPQQRVEDDFFTEPAAAAPNTDADNFFFTEPAATPSSVDQPVVASNGNGTVQSSAVSEWRAKQYEAMQLKEEEEKYLKQEARQAAEEHKKEFYAQRVNKIQARVKSNRENQAAIEEEPQGEVWAAALSLIDSGSKVAEGRTDLTRMHQVLVKMKHKPLAVEA